MSDHTKDQMLATERTAYVSEFEAGRKSVTERETKMYFELSYTAAGFILRIVSDGETVGYSKIYAHREEAMAAVEELRAGAPSAEVVDLTDEKESN